jgi:K+-sensing histidine kinase KdpD
MDLNTKLNHNQNICKDQYIRVNLYTPTTAVHMGQFNSTVIQFICICTISVCQNALNIDVLFFVFLFLVIFNTWTSEYWVAQFDSILIGLRWLSHWHLPSFSFHLSGSKEPLVLLERNTSPVLRWMIGAWH